MKFYLLLLLGLTLNGCMDIPEIPTSEKDQAKEKIENNKYSAVREQEAYLRLQKKREND